MYTMAGMNNPIDILILVGLIVTFIVGALLVAGRGDARAKAPEVRRNPLELVVSSAAAVRAQADVRARTSASTALGRDPFADVPNAMPARQTDKSPDSSDQGRAQSIALAEAIARHLADNDPQRMAEVISQWIKTTENSGRDDR